MSFSLGQTGPGLIIHSCQLSKRTVAQVRHWLSVSTKITIVNLNNIYVNESLTARSRRQKLFGRVNIMSSSDQRDGSIFGL
jgi:cAMP phosphodiesterase